MASHLATDRGQTLLRVPGWRWPLAPVIALPLALFAFALRHTPAALAGTPWEATIRWLPALGLSLQLRLDSLSLIFTLLVTGIGTLVMAYSIPYMQGEYGLARYYASLTLFMLAMLGLVMAGNLLLLFVCWEMTSISSYLLIGFRHEEAESQEAALQALLITGAGGLAMLAGIVLIGQVYGSFDLGVILAEPARLRVHPWYGWALGLILAGAFTKSAQVPFHFWLPGAMVAPTPVSAYLHSATMVKAGIYLLARLAPLLGGTPAWQATLLTVGGLTMLLGAWQALRQHDLKAILAYTTISTLGMMVALLGLGTAAASQAALVTLIAHALYKGALFLVAGAIDHETGTRDVRLLGGLWAYGPALGLVAALAALSMAGLPPTLGFVAKELGYSATLEWSARPVAAGGLALLVLAANACNVALAVVLGYCVFFEEAGGPWPRKPHGASWLLVLPGLLLAAASWLAGLVPGHLDGAIAEAVGHVLPGAHPGHLALWHGWGLPLALSVATLGSGAALYVLWTRRPPAPRGEPRWSALAAYRWLVHRALPAAAAGLTRALQNGSLRFYMIVILASTVVVAGGTLLRSGLLGRGIVGGEAYAWPELLMTGLLVAAALGVVLAPTRLGAILSLGAVGSMVTLLYVRFRAPDLALTQLLIEALTVILLLQVFHYLAPGFEEPVRPRRAALEIVVAASVGLLMAGLVLVANGVQFAPPIARYYLEQSVPLAHGHNVVNVILVDFRGYDTLGEITVLATAAIGVYALLRVRRRKA